MALNRDLNTKVNSRGISNRKKTYSGASLNLNIGC